MISFPDSDPLIEFSYPLRSRYGETDKMGVVYHGHFLNYFEVARTEMIRSYGITYKDMEDDGIMLPVIDAELSFKNPVQYDEPVHIKVLIYDKPGIRLITYYKVISQSTQKECVLGKVTLCFMSAESRRPIRAPQFFLDKMNQAIFK
ncbi:MAG: acyl-CoA thioesterase [Balneolaceae bacterium]|nr:acyl-CoA thioesterase [Balneolaceae bacterium]